LLYVRHDLHLKVKVHRVSQSSISMGTYQNLWSCRLSRMTLALAYVCSMLGPLYFIFIFILSIFL